MRIRPATSADLPVIVEIYNHAVINTTATADYDPQTLENRQKWYDERIELGFPVIIAELDDETIAGWGSLSPYRERIGYRFTVENSVYIADEQKGKGIGKTLLAELVAHATRMKMHAIMAGIDGDNTASFRLHESAGFVLCGRLPQIVRKFDRWLDVVYMVKLLD